MKHFGRVVLLFFVLVAGCGKSGEPLPPIVRTPQLVRDLKVSQNGYKAVLSWTNPGFYVDGNPATDLSAVRILQNGAVVATEPAKGPGQAQTAQIDISRNLDATLTFAVQLATQRGKASAVSSEAMLRIVDVPGVPRNLRAIVDQLRITLEWEVPERNGDLVEVYLVSRADRPTPAVVRGRRFDDAEYEPDQMYTYSVTAARGETGQITGTGSVTVTLVASDKTPPATPAGLTLERLDTGLLLRWTPNAERDLKEHLLFRGDKSDPIYHGRAEVFTDLTYEPGMTYQLAAEDTFGNRSPRSAPIAGP